MHDIPPPPPDPFSPVSPQALVQLLASLELVAMEGKEPPSPRNLSFRPCHSGPAQTTPRPPLSPRLGRCHAARKGHFTA